MELWVDVGAPPIPTARDAMLSSVLDFMVDCYDTVSEFEHLGLCGVGRAYRMRGMLKRVEVELIGNGVEEGQYWTMGTIDKCQSIGSKWRPNAALHSDAQDLHRLHRAKQANKPNVVAWIDRYNMYFLVHYPLLRRRELRRGRAYLLYSRARKDVLSLKVLKACLLHIDYKEKRVLDSMSAASFRISTCDEA
jgi:hypothetical protein